MAVQNLNQSHTAQPSRLNRMATQIAETVMKGIDVNNGVVSAGEAKRLALNLFVRANAALEESKIVLDGGRPAGWGDVDAPKFVMDAMKIVSIGLDAGNNEAYAIPYRNTKTGRVELQCSPSAWGLRKLVIQHSIGKPISDIRPFIIREGDRFTVRHTPKDDIWELSSDPFNSGEILGYVTIALYEDGTSQVMTHTLDDIKRLREASKSPNSPAWTKWGPEMAIAKAIRRHAKRITWKLPQSAQDAFNALESDEAAATLEIEANAGTQVVDLTPAPRAEIETPQPFRRPEPAPEYLDTQNATAAQEEVLEPPYDDGFAEDLPFDIGAERYGF